MSLCSFRLKVQKITRNKSLIKIENVFFFLENNHCGTLKVLKQQQISDTIICFYFKTSSFLKKKHNLYGYCWGHNRYKKIILLQF